MIADILGVQKSTVKNVANLNERLKATKPVRQKGVAIVAREVLQLYGNASLASLPIQTIEGIKGSRSRETTTQWVVCRLTNAAHPSNDSLHLHHWHRLKDTKKIRDEDGDCCMKNEESPTEQEKIDVPSVCCTRIADSDYPASAFNKRAQVVRYSPSFYAKYIAHSSSGWSSWETDYLFDLCEEFDLRFTIILDRYSPMEVITQASQTAKENQLHVPSDNVVPSKSRKRSDSTLGRHSASTALGTMTPDQIKELSQQVGSQQPRTIEQLKDRYYKIVRIVVEQEYKKKIHSIESHFTELLKTTDPSNIEALEHQKSQILAETKDALHKHPSIKCNYDPAIDKQRRDYINQHYTMGEKERRSDAGLVNQIVKEESASFKAARDESLIAKKNKSPIAGITPPLDDDYYNRLVLEAIQHHLSCQRRPGTILASQMMLLFAAPLLLSPPSSSPLPAATGGTILGASGNVPLSRHSSTTAGAHHSHHHNLHHQQHHPHGLQIVKKHEQKIEQELRVLGFDTKSLPLWPTYNDTDIVEAFNALRVDIAILVQQNNKVEQLEKEAAQWRAKVMQMKEETSSSQTQESGRKSGGDMMGGILNQGYSSLLSGGSNKKKHSRPSASGVGEGSVKKPRKPPKKPTTGAVVKESGVEG